MTDLEKQKKILDKLLEVCYSVQKLTGERILIRKGENGYYASDWNIGSCRKKLQEMQAETKREMKL